MKQKIINKGVIYVSKNLREAGIDTFNERFFPFLNSKLFDSQSKRKLSFDKISGICDSTNIYNFLSKRPPCKSFLFFGRSNVGKSSLINKLIGVPVNETSKKPGKTKQLVFLKLNTNQLTYFVDAPGYGYASAASKQQIRRWGKLVELYLKNSPNSQSEQIVLILDINHGIKNVDIMLLDMLKEFKRNFIIVFSKCDKANNQKIQQSQQTAQKLQQKYPNMNYFVHYTSSQKLFGIEQLRNHILFKIISQSTEDL